MTEKLHRLGVYVAGNPRHNRDEIRAFMDWIIDNYNTVYLTCDWLAAMENGKPKEEQGLEEGFHNRRYAAQEDLDGVYLANVLVLFDCPPPAWGIYVEMGAALAMGHKVIVVNPHYLQVFYYHPNVLVAENVEQAKQYLHDLHAIATFAMD